MRRELLDLAADLSRRGEPFAIATVVARKPPMSAQVGDVALVTREGFHGWVGGPHRFRVEAMNGLSFAAMNASTDEKVKARVKQLVEGETLMLFDVSKDPGERTNVIGESKYAKDLTELGKKLLAEMERTDDPQTKAFRTAWQKTQKKQ